VLAAHQRGRRGHSPEARPPVRPAAAAPPERIGEGATAVTDVPVGAEALARLPVTPRRYSECKAQEVSSPTFL